ncbi:MAG: glutamate mutase L [bacterium]|nr:glutamate mutase L [bacterium]
MANDSSPGSILATDCGSTTTKAILIDRDATGYRLVARGEAPTTVEAPFEDVTLGVRNAVGELEELTGRSLLGPDGLPSPGRPGSPGLFLSTSSAGGGLQMMVAGVIKSMTAESAQRAALGAGAIVMDTIAIDDGRRPHEKIRRIRDLRPDMIVLSGGVDGGTVTHVAQVAELIAAARPRPRLGSSFRLPVIYAGNVKAREHIRKVLGELVDLRVVANLRPVMEREELGPAREEIHHLFMEHVMAQAPGYATLSGWTPVPIMPTPGAVGLAMQSVARLHGTSVIGVDIGGATTDVFSVFGADQELFVRTVSANLGMSYSVSNVLLEAGADNVLRWLPLPVSPADLTNRIRNKMIRPTTIPQTLEELLIEQALAREALRLALEHHRTLARGLKGIQRLRHVGETFSQEATGQTHINLMELGFLVGSGGALSHAPRRMQAALMLLDAFQPEGVTRLAVDSIFMMPQLGVLWAVHPEPAAQVFERDCLVHLGTAVAPVGVGRPGERVLTVRGVLPTAGEVEEELLAGQLRVLPLAPGERADLELSPAWGFDVGAGKGRRARVGVQGGVCGLILDGRGRPLILPPDPPERRRKLVEWFLSVDAYPADLLKRQAGPPIRG